MPGASTAVRTDPAGRMRKPLKSVGAGAFGIKGWILFHPDALEGHTGRQPRRDPRKEPGGQRFAGR